MVISLKCSTHETGSWKCLITTCEESNRQKEASIYILARNRPAQALLGYDPGSIRRTRRHVEERVDHLRGITIQNTVMKVP